jgi:hypothetical protein
MRIRKEPKLFVGTGSGAHDLRYVQMSEMKIQNIKNHLRKLVIRSSLRKVCFENHDVTFQSAEQ